MKKLIIFLLSRLTVRASIKTTLGNYGGFEPYVHIFFKTSSYHSYQNLLIYKKTSSLIYHSVLCFLIKCTASANQSEN